MNNDTLFPHLREGTTTICRAWLLVRRDGETLGFTDHDDDVTFEGQIFRAQTGLTARALQQTTGLSVDNSEAVGALSDASVREEDILAGFYDDAEITGYLVNFLNPDERLVLFRGTFGEITRTQGTFQAELRGISERFNLPRGRVLHGECGAFLGDGRCRVNLEASGISLRTTILSVLGGGQMTLADIDGQPSGWFSQGRLRVLDGDGAGQESIIRQDLVVDGIRSLSLWESLTIIPQEGERVLVISGCDRRAETCRRKFDNFLNFRGFPDIPGDDWLRSYPSRQDV